MTNEEHKLVSPGFGEDSPEPRVRYCVFYGEDEFHCSFSEEHEAKWKAKSIGGYYAKFVEEVEENGIFRKVVVLPVESLNQAYGVVMSSKREELRLIQQRRSRLIDKEIAGTISTVERYELRELDCKFVELRTQIAPVMTEDARTALRQLIEKLEAGGEKDEC